MGKPSVFSNSKILGIERLRAFAILSIWIFHLGGYFPQWISTTFASQFSIDLFFVISGYVVAHSFLRSLPTGDPSASTLLRRRAILAFYLRRAFRILPLASICCLYFLVRHQWPPSGNDSQFFANVPEMLRSIGTLQFNYDLVYRQDFLPMSFFWTLIVEEHFYLVLPLVLASLLTLRKRLGFCVAGILLCQWVFQPYTLVLTEEPFSFAALGFRTENRIDLLLTGVGISLGFESGLFRRFLPSNLEKFTPYGIAWSWISLGGLIAFPFLMATPWIRTPLPYLALFCGSLVFLACLPTPTPLVLHLSPRLNRALEYVGSRSYGLYLWHMPVIYELRFTQEALPIFAQTTIGILTLSLLFTFLAAELSFRLVESPLIDRAKRISERMLRKGNG